MAKTKISSTSKIKQMEALHQALVAVHTSESLAEIESRLFSVLHDTLSLEWVRVFLHDTEHLEMQLSRLKNQELFSSALALDGQILGQIVMARNQNKKFNKTEITALKQIAESVAFSLDRLGKLDQAETLRFQWDSTFNSISEPLCLTNEKFQIIRTNIAFLKITNTKHHEVLGANCFYVFSGEKSDIDVRKASSGSFVLSRKSNDGTDSNAFEVSTQEISGETKDSPIYLVMLRDITEQKKIEKQILESAKMVELGTIGSSIAHDINNPLGGMINFLQLIKMGLKNDDPIYEDILEMEHAGQRCKEIVESLLRFTRRQEAGVAQEVDLAEVISQAMKISELQTRSKGILVNVKSDKAHHQKILGHFNLLSQALNHILQNAIEAVSERLKLNPGYKGQINLDLTTGPDGLQLIVEDNGIGISPELQSKIMNPLFSTKNKNQNQGFGLPLAYQIVQEHNGNLEIFSQPNVGTTVKISFMNV